MNTIADLAQSWGIAHPAEMDWIASNFERDTFAASLADRLNGTGSLTPNQLAALQRQLQRAATRAAAPTVDVGEIERRFSTARDNGVKKPAMRLGDFKFKAADLAGANAGGIYVTARVEGESLYLGKILRGHFIRTGLCTEEQQAAIVAVAADPDAAATAYGQRTGNCCVCGRELTAQESIDRFIGPICAEKFGL